MKASVWYCPRYNCLGILRTYRDGFIHFEIETKSGPVEAGEWLERDWLYIGVFE